MATEFAALIKDGKIDPLLLTQRYGGTSEVSIYVNDFIDPKKYADFLKDEGSMENVRETRGKLIRGSVPTALLPLLAQRKEIERIALTSMEIPHERSERRLSGESDKQHLESIRYLFSD